MEGRPNNKNWITKTRDFPWKTTKKLKSSGDINKKGKKSYEQAVWQGKMKSSRTKARGQHMFKG